MECHGAECANDCEAALHAAWTASKVGAISLATLFTGANFAFGAYYVVIGRMKVLELLGVPVGGAAVLALSLPFSLAITVPVSLVVAMCLYPFLRRLGGLHRRAFGIGGFLVASLVWLGAWWGAPLGNLYFGFWFSSFVIGGPAGYAGLPTTFRVRRRRKFLTETAAIIEMATRSRLRFFRR